MPRFPYRGSSFVTDPQPTVHVRVPGECALNDPAMAPEPLAGLDAFTRDADLDPAPGECTAARPVVVGLVRVQPVRTPTRPASRTLDWADRVDQLMKDRRVVAVGRRVNERERNALPVRGQMPLYTRFSSVRGVGAGMGSPPLAGTCWESTHTRDQSILSAYPSRSKSTWWSLSKTPASCHSRNRLQQVMPDPHPISCGSISQGMPLRRTKMMPVRHLRSGTRGRPPFGFGGSGGRSGSIAFHSSSDTSCFAMNTCTRKHPFC